MVQFLGVAVERYTLDLTDSGYVRLAYVRIVLSWYRECVSRGLEFAASDYVGVKRAPVKRNDRGVVAYRNRLSEVAACPFLN